MPRKKVHKSEPAPPPLGDDAPDKTFLSVGRALSQWELLEGWLANMFAGLLGSPLRPSTKALRAYGTSPTFNGRREMLLAVATLNEAAEPSFVERLTAILIDANELASFRNRIAHGIVQPWFFGDDRKEGWGLLPAYYATRHREPAPNFEYDMSTLPNYVYTSSEIDAFAAKFKKLAEDAMWLFGDMIHAHAIAGQTEL